MRADFGKLGGKRKGGVGFSSHVSLFIHTSSKKNPIKTHWVWPGTLHNTFEGNKVHINDKTSQSSDQAGVEGGGECQRTDNRVETESSMQCVKG